MTLLKRVRRRMRNVRQRIQRAIKYEIYAYWRTRPIRADVVLYEAFAGSGVLCNPEAIFRGLKGDPEFAHLRHFWVLKNPGDNPAVVAEFANDDSVSFVKPNTPEYMRALATSHYLINNATFPVEFGKRDGQLYLNTWHGTPLKKMGYDIGDPASRVANVIRNFLNADYLLAANSFMVEQMYEKAHLLRGMYKGRVIEEGYPRIDHQLGGASSARARLEGAGFALGNRTVVLYAPTWKGTNFSNVRDDANELIDRAQELQHRLGGDYLVLLKTHQTVHAFARRRTDVAELLVPNEIPTNVVLAASDALVTDYSSTFFDFLQTDRPIYFLAPDIDDYAGYRGLYMEPEEWPGPVVGTLAELAAAIEATTAGQIDPRIAANYTAMRERFAPHEDGGATERIIDIVFRGVNDGYRVHDIGSGDRRRLLIHAGSMRPNGITSSVIDLVNSIDHTAFDVTVAFPNSHVPAVVDRQLRLSPEVRPMARVGGISRSKIGHALRRARFGEARTRELESELWQNEWLRCFGKSSFDYVVDFSGYSPFWATLLVRSPRARRSIWLHNDMAADAQRVIRKRRRQQSDLATVFSLYSDYDRLVSVSSSLAALNARKLAQFADKDRFVSANNLVDVARIEKNIGSTTRADGAPDATVFLTVGRLSPEKNHARLLRAFARVHSRFRNTRLVIVGAGPLLQSLERLTSELGIADAVEFTGALPNPHEVMAAADCFVLSSDYEGQPMVLLEAAVVGLPIITVDFSSVADALPEGAALIVRSEVEALASGMEQYLLEGIAHPPFDAAAHNRSALDQFYDAIGAVRPSVTTA